METREAQVRARLTSREVMKARLSLDSVLHDRTKSGIFGMVLALAAVILLFLIGWFLAHGGSWKALKDDPLRSLQYSAKDAATTFDEQMKQEFPPEQPSFSASFRRESQQLRDELFGEACCGFEKQDAQTNKQKRKPFEPNLGCC